MPLLLGLKKQHFNVKFWNWGPKTIFHNLPSAKFVLRNHSTLLPSALLHQDRKEMLHNNTHILQFYRVRNVVQHHKLQLYRVCTVTQTFQSFLMLHNTTHILELYTVSKCCSIPHTRVLQSQKCCSIQYHRYFTVLQSQK